MINFYVFICIFFLLSSAAYASINDIETTYKSCLKKSNGSLEMSYCTEQASAATELEIRQLLMDNADNIEYLQENQQLWKEYKKTVDTAVTSQLLKTPGWDYVLFANDNIYTININRLKLLSLVLKNKSYSNENNAIIEKSAQEINNYISTLSKKMPKKEYNNLLINQTSWEKYKNNVNKLLSQNNKSQKKDILKDLYIEREHQLWSLDFIYSMAPMTNKNK